jgi:flagellar hook-length control protein FliK
MFVDLSSQGLFPDIGKIAIKMPKGQGDMDASTCGGFADIINALMSSLPADELRQSLEQLEWVPLEEGDVADYAPLIDLTRDQSNTIGMAERLLNEAPSETLRQVASLKSVLFPAQGEIDLQQEIALPEAGENEADRPSAFQKAPKEVDHHRPGTVLARSAQHPLPQAETPSAAMFDHDPQKKRQDAPGVPMAGDKAGKIKAAVNDLLPGKEMPSAVQHAEGLERENRPGGSEKNPASVTSFQQLKRQLESESKSDQQSTGNPDQEAALLAKGDGRTRSRADAPARDIQPAMVDSSSKTTPETESSITKAGSEHREPLQGSMARVKFSAGEPVEGTAGGKEMHPASSEDMQTRVIRQIVQRMTLRSQGTQSTMTIKLKPEYLGQVQMQISTDQQQVMVRMATESIAVKEMVEQGLQHLKTELQQHGLEIDKFDVFVANDNEESKRGQDWAGFRQGLNRRRRDGLNPDDGDKGKRQAPLARDVDGRQPVDGVGEVDYFA